MLETMKSPPRPQPGYMSLIATAAKHGHYSLVKYISSSQRSTLAELRYLNNYLLRAVCENGHDDILGWLFTEYCFSSRDVKSGYNACLRCASANGHINIVRLLFKKFSFGVKDVRYYECMAVRMAGVNGHVDVMKFLLLTFPELTIEDMSGGNGQLFRLCLDRKHQAVLQVLVDYFGEEQVMKAINTTPALNSICPPVPFRAPPPNRKQRRLSVSLSSVNMNEPLSRSTRFYNLPFLPHATPAYSHRHILETASSTVPCELIYVNLQQGKQEQLYSSSKLHCCHHSKTGDKNSNERGVSLPEAGTSSSESSPVTEDIKHPTSTDSFVFHRADASKGNSEQASPEMEDCNTHSHHMEKNYDNPLPFHLHRHDHLSTSNAQEKLLSNGNLLTLGKESPLLPKQNDNNIEQCNSNMMKKTGCILNSQDMAITEDCLLKKIQSNQPMLCKLTKKPSLVSEEPVHIHPNQNVYIFGNKSWESIDHASYREQRRREENAFAHKLVLL